MDKRKFIQYTVIILVIAVAAGLLIARLQKRPVTQLEDAKTIYMNAADAAADLHNYVLNVTQTHQIITEKNTYTESTNILLSCEGLGSDKMKISKEEALTSGKHSALFSEIFSRNTLYTVINDSHFISQITTDAYMQKMVPVALMNYHLYNSFSEVDSGEEYVIHIEDATAPEAWAYSGDITFTKASGTAYVTYEGILKKSVYLLEYTQSDISHRLTFVSELTEDTPEVVVPENTDSYIQIQYADGAKMLERASGFLTQMDNIRASCKETTYFQAFGDTRTKTIALETKNDIDWSATVHTETTLANESRPDQDSVYTQTETFKLGVYKTEITGIPTAQNMDISEEQMQSYCLNILVSTIMLPKDIVHCQMKESNGVIQITYLANKEFAQQISKNACSTLYQNPDILAEVADANIADDIIGYLELDSATGLPISSGISYANTYTTEGLPYLFRFEANQTYQITS